MNLRKNRPTVIQQSDVPHDFEIDEVFATRADLKDFKSFCKKLEIKYKHKGAVKVIPYEGFDSGFREIPQDFKLNSIIKRKRSHVSSGRDYAYEVAFVDRNHDTFGNYYNQLKKKEIEDKLSPKEIKKIENSTWKAVKNNKINNYSSDQNTSLFADSCEFGNLNKFTIAESFLHTKAINHIEGIHIPYSYVGDIHTVFPLHIEDFDLYALNFLHLGYKFWYIIPGSQREKLETLVNRLAKDSNITCNNFIRHKSLMIPPSVLKENNIQFSRVLQEKNQYIVVFSGGFHTGFNCGYNIAEAINVGADGWLEEYPKFKLCDCVGPMNDNMLIVKETLDKVYNKEIEAKKNINSFKCSVCQISLKTNKLLKRHMVTHELIRQRFYCTKCPSAFTRERQAKTHSEKKHESLSFTECFITKLADNPHPEGRKPTNLRKFTCEFPHCDVTVYKKHGRKQHMKICPYNPKNK